MLALQSGDKLAAVKLYFLLSLNYAYIQLKIVKNKVKPGTIPAIFRPGTEPSRSNKPDDEFLTLNENIMNE
jgi:hypothetical protein